MSDSGDGAHEPHGRTRRGRMLALSAIGIALTGGLLLAMANGAIAASFTISGALGKLSADNFVGEGIAQYSSVEHTDDGAKPVLTGGFREARADNFCVSFPVTDLPGVGPVTLRLTTPGEQGLRADDLLVSFDELSGDMVQRNVELGRDASELDLDKGPADATGAPGAFGLQADSLEVANFRNRPRAMTAATLRLDQVRMAIGAQERECF